MVTPIMAVGTAAGTIYLISVASLQVWSYTQPMSKLQTYLLPQEFIS